MKADQSLSCLFPETIQVKNANDVCSFLEKHHHISLKSISHNLGTEIITVLLDSKKQYEVQHCNKIIRFTDKNQLVSYVTDNIQFACYLDIQHIPFMLYVKKIIK